LDDEPREEFALWWCPRFPYDSDMRIAHTAFGLHLVDRGRGVLAMRGLSPSYLILLLVLQLYDNDKMP
jgi:hypothetical protein